MIVYLLRHGIAEDAPPGGDDRARRLTAAGTDRLEQACRGWTRIIGDLDRILHSPLVRAQQTAAILQRGVRREAPLVETPLLVPAARATDTLELLQAEHRAGTRGIACVGHEPHLGALFGLLLTGSVQTAVPLKKGMLAAVEIASSASMVGRLVAALSQRAAGGLHR